MSAVLHDGPIMWCSFAIVLGIVTALTIISPGAAIAVTILCLVVGLMLYLRTRLPRIVVIILSILLGGYLFFGRGFAYLGYPPFFVGEIVLFISVLAFVICRCWRFVPRGILTWLLAVFIIWGAVRTVPFISEYRIDALRDAVVWGYATFAIIVAGFVGTRERVAAAVAMYSKLIPWLLIWFPIFGVSYLLFRDVLPVVPGTDVQLLGLKFGDMGVHLAGIAGFMALNLHAVGRRSGGLLVQLNWVWWAVWLFAFLIAASNRGGMLAGLVALLVLVALRPFSRSWWKILIIALVLSPIALSVTLRPNQPSLGEGLVIRAKSAVDLALGDESETYRAGSARWRLNWWEDILDYTILGEYFWSGKGYGINLANSDGYQVFADESLRSPHNGHLTLLARSGVPGVALWILLQASFAIALVRAYFKARSRSDSFWAAVNLWILVYWTAFMVNTSFDVFLEGPQGGIWFWSLFGFGIACLSIQQHPAEATGARHSLLAHHRQGTRGETGGSW